MQGDLTTLEQLQDWALTPDGSVKLSDIAQVEQGKDLKVISLTNGGPSVTLNIVRSSTANTVEVADKVNQVYADAEKDGQVKTLVMYNRATDVKESVNSLAREGALGALFASILILFFLRNVRATLIAIVSIPLSMLIAMICLKTFTDVTLNIMTLGGLAVATGRVVDDSIVVIENIVRRMRGEKIGKELIHPLQLRLAGRSPLRHADDGRRVRSAWVPARHDRRLLPPFALTVGFALVSSLLVALTVVPLMAWVLMRNVKLKEAKPSAMSNGYKRALSWSLRHKATVIIVALLLFVGSLVPIFAGKVGVVLLPQSDYKYMFANLTMPKGTAIGVVKKEADRLDEIIRNNKDVENTNLTVGGRYERGRGREYRRVVYRASFRSRSGPLHRRDQPASEST